MTLKGMSCVTVGLTRYKEPSLYNYPECQFASIGQNLQHFIGNGDVAIRMTNCHEEQNQQTHTLTSKDSLIVIMMNTALC